MTRKRYSPFQFLMHRIVSSRLGSWFASVTLHHFDRVFLKLTSGRSTISSLLGGLPVVILTTIGAKSGLPRTLPLLFIRNEQNPATFALIASNWGQAQYPAWYFNVKANPLIICSKQGQIGEYMAHEANGEEYERFWRFAEKTFFGYPLYRKRTGERRIPIMVMTPLQF